MKAIWEDKNKVYQAERKRVEQMKGVVASLEQQLVGLKEEINKGEEIREGNQQKMTDEMLYHMKFEEEMNLFKQEIEREQARERQLKRKIKEKESRVNKLQGKVNNDKGRHEAEMRLMDYEKPRASIKPNNIKEILEMEEKFNRTTKTLMTMTATF